MTDNDEVLGKEAADALDKIIAEAGPGKARSLGADVVSHRRGARRENGYVGTALALQLQLRAFQARPDLIVADFRVIGRRQRGIFQPGDLGSAVFLQFGGCRGVVTVTINDHESSSRFTKTMAAAMITNAPVH